MFTYKLLQFTAALLLIFASSVQAGEIYATSFESGSLVNNSGFRWQAGVKSSISSDRAKSGKYSLKFSYPGVPIGKDSFSEQRFKLTSRHRELWIEYDLYVPSNYYHRKGPGSDNNKAYVWMWTGEYRDKTVTKLGGHLWANSDGTSRFIAYHRNGLNGQKNTVNWWCSTCSNGQTSNGIVRADRGKWMHLKIHMKYATSANNDGVYEIWKTNGNGITTKIINIHNGHWYSDNGITGFDAGYIFGWSNSGFDENTYFYIDNFTISADTSAVITALPKPPVID